MGHACGEAKSPHVRPDESPHVHEPALTGSLAQVSGWDTPDPQQPKTDSEVEAKPSRRAVKVKAPTETAEKVPQSETPDQQPPKKGFFGRIKDWIK